MRIHGEPYYFMSGRHGNLVYPDTYDAVDVLVIDRYHIDGFRRERVKPAVTPLVRLTYAAQPYR